MDSKISLSHIKLSSNESWGPDPSFIFEQYRNLPFAPFNKLEKLGKFCDISNSAGRPTTSSVANTSSLPVEGAEEEFTVIDSKINVGPAVKTTGFNRIVKPQGNQQPKRYPAQNNRNPRYNNRVQVTRTKFKDNTNVQSDWNYILDVNNTNFNKMPVNNVKVADIATVGSIGEYDKAWEGKLSQNKKNAPFTLPNTISFNTGPRNDKFLLDLIEKERGTESLTIYTTDVLLSAVLTTKNSVFPWDVTVTKEGNQIFLEQSEKNKLNYIDILTVNENTAKDLPEDEKDLLKLCIESTNVNKKFVELSTKGTETKDFSSGNASQSEVPDRKAYRYRRWTLDNKINIVVRSEIDAFVKEGNETQFVKVCALNECQSQSDWKQHYETNRGALISSELRTNLSKVCRWLCQAFLAECNTFKIGFVTKPNPKEAKHTVLTVEDMTTVNLSNTVSFRIKDNWSIIKTVADLISKQEDGVFALVKQAYKQSIRIYQVPERDEQVEA